MSKLRYDLVVEAMMALSRYVDTCPEDTNTVALVSQAAEAIRQLKAIERGRRQIHRADKPATSNVLTALAEVEASIIGTRSHVQQVQEFLDTYKDELQVMKQVVNSTFLMAEIVGTMRGLDRQLKMLQRQATL